MTVPSALTDLGLTAVSLFLFVSAIWLVLKIIQAVRGGGLSKTKEIVDRPPCVQSQEWLGLATGQAVYLKAIERVADDTREINTSIALQTQLLERVAAVQEKLADLAVRREAIIDKAFGKNVR